MLKCHLVGICPVSAEDTELIEVLLLLVIMNNPEEGFVDVCVLCLDH